MEFMVLMQSNMIPLRSRAPDFKLVDIFTDEMTSLKEIQSDIGTVVMFICNHCPYMSNIYRKCFCIISRLHPQRDLLCSD